MYRITVNDKKKDKLYGMKPQLQRISKYFNATKLKEFKRIEKCIGYFILNNKLPSKEELKEKNKHILLLPKGDYLIMIIKMV